MPVAAGTQTRSMPSPDRYQLTMPARQTATIGARGHVMEPTPDAPGNSGGQPAEALFAEVYARLKAMAARQLALTPKSGTLETTALVHELYLRMSANHELVFGHRAQFF